MKIVTEPKNINKLLHLYFDYKSLALNSQSYFTQWLCLLLTFNKASADRIETRRALVTKSLEASCF
jgi:hypothetical protein